MSMTAGSSSHSASMSASASSACARVSATTAATASPCQQARSMAIACCGGDLMPFRCPSTATQGVQYSATARPSKTPITPGMVARLRQVELLDLARARTGCGKTRRARAAESAGRRCRRRAPAAGAARSAAARSGRCSRGRSCVPGRVQRQFSLAHVDHLFDGVDDRLVAGAAAVVAGNVLADLLARRLSASAAPDPAPPAACPACRSRTAARSSRGRPSAARASSPESRQALDGVHPAAVRLHREHQAAAHDLAVDAHRAGAADAVLAAGVRAGQAEFLAQEIDQVLRAARRGGAPACRSPSA